MRSKIVCGALALIPWLVACAGTALDGEESGPVGVGVDMEGIVGGTPATAYPEGAVLTMKSATGQSYGCSATLIAPQVVLTAGHCVDGMTSWDVYVGTAYRPAASAETYDWAEHGATTVNPQHHDIGLVYLKEPINLPSYPVLNNAKQADGTKGVVVGRVLNGNVTSSLYQGSSSITDGTKVGYPYAYYSPAIIEHGDSGGPFFLAGTHTIAAVNSGAGSGTQVLARVDLLSSWIAQRVASHASAPAMPAAGSSGLPKAPVAGSSGASAAKGGSGGVGGSAGMPASAGSKASAGAGGMKAVAGAGASAACAAEVEPNNDAVHASTLGALGCGSLASATDVDWFVTPLSAGTTTFTLTADKDATFSIGYMAGTGCATALTGARQVRLTANASNAKICIAVSSASHSVQGYKLSR